LDLNCPVVLAAVAGINLYKQKERMLGRGAYSLVIIKFNTFAI